MRVKKFGGKVYGADLTAAEKKAMNIEIQKQLAEYDLKHMVEIDAIILFVLQQQLGWGEKRLRRFYNSVEDEVDALIKRYQMEEGDRIWLCTHILKNNGIDVEKWAEERAEKRNIQTEHRP